MLERRSWTQTVGGLARVSAVVFSEVMTIQ